MKKVTEKAGRARAAEIAGPSGIPPLPFVVVVASTLFVRSFVPLVWSLVCRRRWAGGRWDGGDGHHGCGGGGEAGSVGGRRRRSPLGFTCVLLVPLMRSNGFFFPFWCQRGAQAQEQGEGEDALLEGASGLCTALLTSDDCTGFQGSVPKPHPMP
jgi:hypothetical protein